MNSKDSGRGKVWRNVRSIYHIIAVAIFTLQAYQSLNKYFQYPVVYHESTTSINTIQKPSVQVSILSIFLFIFFSVYILFYS